jgi:hypothetical protein
MMSDKDLDAIMDMLKMADGNDNGDPQISFVDQAARLCNHAKSLANPIQFKVGDIVMWREGMKNRRVTYGKPLLVVEVLDKPVFDKEKESAGAGSPYFREPLNIVLGELDENGDMNCYHHDSRRLQYWEDRELKSVN